MRNALAALLLFAAPALAGTIMVDNDFAECPQADFNTIQLAVAAAQPGDKILVCPGVYTEMVLVDKDDLRIEAQAAPGEVILQGTPAQPAGFYLTHVSEVRLQGFQVQGFREANIRIEGGGRNGIRNNVSTSSGSHGIQIVDSAGNTLEHNITFGNPLPMSSGINISGAGSMGNTVQHNESYGNAFGILLTNAGTGNVIFHNVVHHNRTAGIRNFTGSSGSVIENNDVFSNGQAGIAVFASAAVIVRNNRIESNSGGGIVLLEGTSGALVEKNESRANLDGIRVFAPANGNVIRLNNSDRNNRDGIRMEGMTAGNTIERNVMRQNVEHDAHDDSGGPGTGGTGNFWISNRCETENRPELCRP